MIMPLFENIPEPRRTRKGSPIALRRRRVKEAFANADERWVKAYTQYILDYAETASEPFSAEDVRLRFLSDKSQPQTHHQQASGGIFIRLVRAGKLRPVGYKASAIFGNAVRTYLKG
jgi:hypothetical protein